MKRLHGFEAIEHAEQNGVAINKYNDAVEPASCDVELEHAKKVALEDPSLIWVEVVE